MPAGGSRHSPPPSQAKLVDASSGILPGACAEVGLFSAKAVIAVHNAAAAVPSKSRLNATRLPLEAGGDIGMFLSWMAQLLRPTFSTNADTLFDLTVPSDGARRVFPKCRDAVRHRHSPRCADRCADCRRSAPAIPVCSSPDPSR